MIDEDYAYEIQRQKRLDASPMFVSLGIGNFQPPAKAPATAQGSEVGKAQRKEILRLLELEQRTAEELAIALHLTTQGVGYHLRILAGWDLIDKVQYGDGASARWKLK